MIKKNYEKKIVVQSISNIDNTLCVDIFKRADKSFGFEEYRRDSESNDGWYKIGGFSYLCFSSECEAYQNACKNIVWLD